MPYLKINYKSEEGKPIFESVSLPRGLTRFLNRCHDLIGCNSIEIPNTILPGIVMIIDEQGKCKDGWEEKINIYASFLYASPFDPIVGNVILAHRVDAELYPLSEGEIYHIVQTLSHYFSLEVKKCLEKENRSR